MSYLIFKNNSLEDNLHKFNKWNYLLHEIANNPDAFSSQFKATLLAILPEGFGAIEEWTWNGNNFEVTKTVVKNQQKQTLRWATPIKHPTEAWIAMPLPDFWDRIFPLLRDEAMAVLGSGEVVGSLDWFPTSLSS